MDNSFFDGESARERLAAAVREHGVDEAGHEGLLIRREQGAQVRALEEWRSRRTRKSRSPTREAKLSSHEVDDWEAYFSTGGDDDPAR